MSDSQGRTTRLDWVLRYIRLGWPVIPLQGKLPLTQHGSKDATLSEAQARAWWAEWPNANIGVATGHRFFVLDVDIKNGGEESFEYLIQQHGAFADTAEQITGTGGKHLLFLMPDFPVKNSANVLAPGLDIRGVGGYIVVSPSVHPETGRRYLWDGMRVLEQQPIAPAPAWLLERLRGDLDKQSAPKTQPVANAIAEGERNTRMFKLACSLRRKGLSGEEILATLKASNALRCKPPLPIDELQTIANSSARYRPEERARVFAESSPPDDATGQNPPAGIPPAQVSTGLPPGPDLLPFPLTDSGNGERMRILYGQEIRYCTEMKKWLVWDGKRWAIDELNVMRQKAKLMARLLYLQAAEISDSGSRKVVEAWARRSESYAGISNALGQAETEAGIPISALSLDQQPMLLNCPNGMVDLRTMELLPHNRELLITKLCPVPFDPEAECPLFLRFLERAMGARDDAETGATTGRLVGFLQRALGYGLTADVSEKAVFVCFGGGGNNGKTTLLTLFRDLLGRDYANLLLIETVMAAKQTDATARADLADLRGARFVQTSEVGKEDRLNEQRIKYLTQGMGYIKSRRLYENPLEFEATHKLYMDCNYRPRVTGVDDAIWRRLKLIPFEVTIPLDEIDTALPDKLRLELPGILAWAVRGARAWYCEGLGDPPEVAEAGTEWREHDDPLKEFLEDCCVVGEDLYATVSDVMAAYQWWAKQAGERFPLNKSAFNERMFSKRFHNSDKTRQRIEGKLARCWKGLELNTETAHAIRRSPLYYPGRSEDQPGSSF